MKVAVAAAVLLVGGCLSMVIGGFIFGFVQAGVDEDSGFDVLGRTFVGIVFAFLTPLSGGYPPKNEGGVGEPFNAWPYIIPTYVVFCAVSLLIFIYYRRRL